ncbi:SRPBCC family protein [Algibacillus agarilyticus]|uniref:SRPBCC family protein n=1 Tax=Algibacillus agarilyticus TaxID=2234133 RepID=UPI000DD0703A|nr:SRPBCC family protein [Algibacillus agarilyticus]
MNKPQPRELVIDIEYEIAAPVDDVFAFICNPENDKHWQSSFDSIKMHNPDTPLGVGTTYTIHFRFLSRKLHFDSLITGYDINKRYTYETTSGSLPFKGVFEFTPTAKGTLVKWHFAAIPGKFFGIIPKSLIKKSMEKRVWEDVEGLKRYFNEKRHIEQLATA